MAGKVFSSRSELNINADLFGLLNVYHTSIGIPGELPVIADNDELLDLLRTACQEVLVYISKLRITIENFSFDLLALTLKNSSLSKSLADTVTVLEALTVPPNGTPFDRALAILEQSTDATGDPELLCFTKDGLESALRIAIEEYNCETSQLAL